MSKATRLGVRSYEHGVLEMLCVNEGDEMKNRCNCPDCQTSDCPALAETSELAEALRNLSQASLRLAQCWNKMDSSEGVSAVESADARQSVDVARKDANVLLAKLK